MTSPSSHDQHRDNVTTPSVTMSHLGAGQSHGALASARSARHDTRASQFPKIKVKVKTRTVTCTVNYGYRRNGAGAGSAI